MRKSVTLSLISLFLLLFAACGTKDDVNSGEAHSEEETIEQEEIAPVEPAEVELFDIADEVGFSLEAPDSEVDTVLPFQGTIEKADDLNDDHIWIIVRKIDRIDEIDNKEYAQFIPVSDGDFSAN